MPSVHTLKGIVSSVSGQAGSILALLNDKWARSDIIAFVQQKVIIPIRSQEIGRTISVIDTQRKSWFGMRKTGLDKVIRQGYGVVKEPGMKQYSTIIESDVIDTRTGVRETRYTQIYHDEPAIRRDIEAEAKEILETSEVSPWLEVEKQRPVQGFVYLG